MNNTRFRFIDGLRGLAALAVCLFHIGRDFLELNFLHYGSLGVTVFFVLSGYVISHSLVDKVVSGKFFISFAIKRSLRLDPAYWVAIFLAILVAWIPSLLFDYSVELPSISGVLIHMIYLQDITGIDRINSVFWTLCYEIQFYLVFCGILFLRNKLFGTLDNRKSVIWMFSVLFSISLLWPLGFFEQLHPGLFINLWYLFLLGVFARWASDSNIAASVFWLAVIVLLLAVNSDTYTELLTGALTAAILFLAMFRNTMHSWLSWGWIQYLGKISYSLYLVHDIVGIYVRDTGLHLSSKYLDLSSLLVNYIWCSIALFASIIVAHALYRLIEYPSHALSRRVDVTNLRSQFMRGYKHCYQILKKTD